jgi:hypothetical protein
MKASARFRSSSGGTSSLHLPVLPHHPFAEPDQDIPQTDASRSVGPASEADDPRLLRSPHRIAYAFPRHQQCDVFMQFHKAIPP